MFVVYQKESELGRLTTLTHSTARSQIVYVTERHGHGSLINERFDVDVGNAR